MKKLLPSIVLSLLTTVAALSQITVSNATFPSIGDELTTATSVVQPIFDPEEVGGNIVWDFTNFTALVSTTLTYVDAAEGSAIEEFPDADLMQVASVVGQDIYYKTSNNRIVEVGRSGVDPIFAAVDFDAAVDGNAVLRRAPLTFGDTYDDMYGFGLEIPVSALPDSIAGVFGGLVSDVRVRVDFEIFDEVDAWGTVNLPASVHEVVRLNRETTTSTMVEVNFLGAWVNLLDLPVPLPEFVEDIIRPSTVNNYIFLSDDSKEEIANITVDSTGTILSAVYKSDVISSANEVQLSSTDIVAYPNPSYGDITFRLQALPADEYRVAVYDILGRQCWSGTAARGKDKLHADLSANKAGTYIYRVYDSAGRKIATKRLMILRP